MSGPLMGVLMVVAALALVGGCRTFSVEEQPVRPTPVRPLWSEETLREHLRFFNGADVGGRATGTAGYATAAAYVAARLREFGLQPGLDTDYRVLYETPIRQLRAAQLVGADAEADTLIFYPGVDFLPDGRSDSGRVQVNALVLDPVEAPPLGPGDALLEPAVLMPVQRAETAYLRTLRVAGARVIFLVGPLAPRLASAPVKGLVVVQLSLDAAAHLLHVAPGDLSDLLLDEEREQHSLSQPVEVRVEAQALSHAGALNVMGFVVGTHPELSNELVIVAADLDAVGTFAGVRTLDTRRLGVATAALLEAARLYGYFAQFTHVPERTILFVVFSGARQGHVGLQAYLRHPLWPFDLTHAVVYLGLDPSDRAAVRELFAPHDLPLHAVDLPPDSLGPPRTLLLPERRPPRQRTADDAPRLSDLIESGVQRARQMADSLNDVLLRETVTPAPFMPARADTLDVPISN